MLLVSVLILSKAQNRCDFTYKIIDGRLRLILAESCVHLVIILSLSLVHNMYLFNIKKNTKKIWSFKCLSFFYPPKNYLSSIHSLMKLLISFSWEIKISINFSTIVLLVLESHDKMCEYVSKYMKLGIFQKANFCCKFTNFAALKPTFCLF